MFIHFFTMYVYHVDVGVYKYTFITHLQYSYSFFITITRVYMLCSVHPNLLTATATATTTTAAATTPFDPKLLYTSHKYTTCVVQYSRSVCAVCSDVVSHVVYMLHVTVVLLLLVTATSYSYCEGGTSKKYPLSTPVFATNLVSSSSAINLFFIQHVSIENDQLRH